MTTANTANRRRQSKRPPAPPLSNVVDLRPRQQAEGGGRWLSIYEPPVPIRRRGAVHLYATQRMDCPRQSPRIVAVPSPDADPKLSARRFDRALAVHRAVVHPRIPRPAERGEHNGAPYLAFECSATADGETVLRQLAERAVRISYGAADSFIAGLRAALQVGHRCRDELGRPICLGTMSYGNVLFDPSGNHWLLGLGTNLITELETGAPGGEAGAFQAPEVAAGGAASPSGDYLALQLMMRSLMPYVIMPRALERILRGEPRPEDQDLAAALVWIEQHVFSAPPALRASVVDAVAKSEVIRSLLGETLDASGFAESVAQVLEGAHRHAASATLLIGLGGKWIQTQGGERRDLTSHPAIQRILWALVQAHQCGPEAIASTKALVESGWPGEQMSGEAGANRVYVAIATLRKLGLRRIIRRRGRGYQLDPHWTIDVT